MDDFATSLTAWEWFYLFAAWCVLAVAAALAFGRIPRPTPEPRLWECSDGMLRTEAAMAEWLYSADGESAWLSVWPADDDAPLYVPSHWVA